MIKGPVEVYPLPKLSDEVLEAAWEQTPPVELPKATKSRVASGFLPIHDALPDDTSVQ